MLGRDKNRVSTIKQTTKIKQTYTIPANQVRQQIRHGTSLLGGPTTSQYTNAQQYTNQQGYTGYTPDPYLTNLPGQQQPYGNMGSNIETKVERKIEQNISSKYNQGYGTNMTSGQYVTGQNTMLPGQTNMVPVQSSTSAFGASMPMGTNVMQKKRSTSSSSSSSEDKNRMKNTGGNLGSSNVETLGQTRPYPQNTYTTQLPFQQGNIQTGYGTTEVGYGNPNMYVTNPLQSTLYRSSTQRKGPILGKNLYGQTGFASSGYSIQQPFPGQNVYIEEDPAKISEQTKVKFEKSIM